VENLSIRPMTEGDLEPALAIDLAAFHSGHDAHVAAAEQDRRATRERQLREELGRTWARVRVACGPAGEVLGYALFWHVVDEIHVLNVAVAPPSRRKGVGAALVSDLLAYGRANGAVKVLLEARASNQPALALYERFGFSRYNVRKRYYADGEDGVEMMLHL
jgi:ribosomal-protein-alanine N-acetyltransferase